MKTEISEEFKAKLSQLLGDYNAELWGTNGSPITIYFGEDKRAEEDFHTEPLCGKNCGFGYYSEILDSAVFEDRDQSIVDAQQTFEDGVNAHLRSLL
jgi:hypothetical protein